MEYAESYAEFSARRYAATIPSPVFLDSINIYELLRILTYWQET